MTLQFSGLALELLICKTQDLSITITSWTLREVIVILFLWVQIGNEFLIGVRAFNTLYVNKVLRLLILTMKR